jgi:hypothetical protein
MDGTDQQPRKLVLRLGGRVNLEKLPSLPERFRTRVSHLSGNLGMLLLRPTTGEAWCRLSSGLSGQIWPPSVKRLDARTYPLNFQQPVTPTPDAIDLHPHMYCECRDGYVGKLEGVVIDALSGAVTGLLVRMRTGVEEDISGPRDPLAALVEVAGRQVLVPPSWAKSPETVNHLIGSDHHLKLDASASQVAHSLELRGDARLLQDVYAILQKNHALASYLSDFRISVHDGDVTIAGVALSPRLRASVEQDIWHVPGVLNVHNQLDAGAGG